jgi:hypothetical protein
MNNPVRSVFRNNRAGLSRQAIYVPGIIKDGLTSGTLLSSMKKFRICRDGF